MKILKLIILFTIIVKVAYPQKKCSFHYVLNERITAPRSKVPLLGIEQEFVTERKYYTPVVFSETRLFTGDNKKSILFKINKGIWYYKSSKKWKLFYNYNKMTGGTILLLGIRYKVSFKKGISVNNSGEIIYSRKKQICNTSRTITKTWSLNLKSNNRFFFSYVEVDGRKYKENGKTDTVSYNGRWYSLTDTIVLVSDKFNQLCNNGEVKFYKKKEILYPILNCSDFLRKVRYK